MPTRISMPLPGTCAAAERAGRRPASASSRRENRVVLRSIPSITHPLLPGHRASMRRPPGGLQESGPQQSGRQESGRPIDDLGDLVEMRIDLVGEMVEMAPFLAEFGRNVRLVQKLAALPL